MRPRQWLMKGRAEQWSCQEEVECVWEDADTGVLG